MTTTTAIRTTAEQSVLAYFDANASLFPNTLIHVGQTDGLRSATMLILACESAGAPSDFGAESYGNFDLTFKIYIFSSADDSTLDDHRQRVELVQALMQDVATLKSYWTQGTLYKSWFLNDEEGHADRRFGNVLTFTMFAVYPSA